VSWNGSPLVESVFTPQINTAFKLLLSLRLTSAVWSNISDCDETFNYWEPVSAHVMETLYSEIYALGHLIVN